VIRNLAIIAAASLVVSVATLSAAFFIAGPENVLNHGAWTYGPYGWGHWSGHSHWREQGDDSGPQVTRDLAWAGGDSLTIDVDAEVRYTQAPGTPKVTVSGPRSLVDNLEMVDGRIRYAQGVDHGGRVTLTISAPAVTHFILQGSERLDIAGYRQDSLTLDVQGDADVKAAGEAKSIKLTISGSGDADLAALKGDVALVNIKGSGSAKLAPAREARIDVEGSGEVDLLTNPPKLATHISGSGRVTHGEQTAGGD
jgi:hypothetical protein